MTTLIPQLNEALEHSTRVLLIEDDPLTRHLVRKIFWGRCLLATATTAEAAKRLSPGFDPDIIFLDLGLPDQSGATIMPWLRAKFTDARLVLFTKSKEFDLIDQLLVMGADGCVHKPFHRETMLSYLNSRS